MNTAETEMHSLADYLMEQKDSIIESYQEFAKNNDTLVTLRVLSRDEFLNNIPDFITHLAKQLRNEDHKINQLSREHGVHRWKLDLNLREVLEEWELLYKVLTDEINKAKNAISISRDTLSEGHQQVCAAIFRGVKLSVNEYYHFQEMEAKAQLADMESVIKDYDEQNELHGQNLRQASHDLGSSVALIQMNLYLLKKENLSKKAREIVENLSVASNNLVTMLRSLLRLFRLEAGGETLEVEEFDASNLLKDLYENLKPLAEKRNIKLTLNGPETLIIRGDKIKIWRIVQNLMMNSLKYTDEGQVEISWNTHSDNHWLISIKDTGPGLDSTNAAVFSKTETQNDAKKLKLENNIRINIQDPDEINMHSEGIGLSIVRRLCQLLLAIVEVKSEKGKGTEFRIMFPVDYKDEKPAN